MRTSGYMPLTRSPESGGDAVSAPDHAPTRRSYYEGISLEAPADWSEQVRFAFHDPAQPSMEIRHFRVAIAHGNDHG